MNKIAVIGLGYVGLPVAKLLATKYSVVGFDINPQRVSSIKRGEDVNQEIDEQQLKEVLLHQHPFKKVQNLGAFSKKEKVSAHSPQEFIDSASDIVAETSFYDHSEEITYLTKGLYCTLLPEDIKECNCFIITVPTHINPDQQPDLTQLIDASKMVAKYLKVGDLVIYESTVYPGVTEGICVSSLESISKLKLNNEFYVGYSPERINTGDKEHTIENVVKITSGSCPEALKRVDNLYKSVIAAGTYAAPSIKIAEAAKIVENSQRDVNIAFVNELSKIMSHLNLNTNEVLKAAESKWNFIRYNPGLVGGNCIGMAPILLAAEAKKKGCTPLLIDASRKVNNSMSAFVAGEIIKLMTNSGLHIKNAKILVLGVSFKENCNDVRNSKAIDLIADLKSYGCNVQVYDPICNAAALQENYGIQLEKDISSKKYHAIVAAVAHDEFYDKDYKKNLEVNGVIYDLKGILKGKADKTL